MSHFLKKVKQRYFTRDGDTLYFGALKRIVFIFLLFVFLLFVALMSWIKFVQKSEDNIKVPRIIGMDILEASEILQNRKLSLKIIPVVNNEIPRYKIIQQNPAPNTTVKEGRLIEVVISSGQIYSRMPDFRNKPIHEVKQLFLGQRNAPGMGKIVLSGITYAASDKPVNTIIAQTPAPDSSIARDNLPVTLVVSNGIDYSKFQLPSYMNVYFEKAVKELAARNIHAKIVSVISEPGKMGKVISQQPQRGASVFPGDEVTLTVGTGARARSLRQAVVIQYIVPSGTSNNKTSIKIVITDDTDDHIIFQGDAVAGERITEAVMVRGSAKVKIYTNNVLVKDDTIQ